MRWRVYYADGSVYDDQLGPPELAPKTGVLVIAQTDPETGVTFAHSRDFYVWRDGWQDADPSAFWFYLAEPGVKVVLFGQLVPNAVYRAALMRAMHDPEFPRKSAWYPREREVVAP